MKSSVLIILAILLTTAILAPSVMTLTSLDEKGITIDFNEEEKKEGNEKDFFLDSNLNTITHLEADKTRISYFYPESDYGTSLIIFLPPPERFS